MRLTQLPPDFQPRTILVVRDSRVGDVLLATPAIRRIKERFPDAQLDVLTSRYAKKSGVLARNPNIRRVYSSPKNSALKLLRCLLLPKYDLVVPIRRRPLFRWIRSRCTLGPNAAQPRGPHVVQLSENAIGFEPDDRVVPMEIYPSDAEIAQARGELAAGAIGVYPSCAGSTIREPDPTNSRRVWRAAEVVAAVRGLRAAGWPVVLFGGTQDEGRALEELALGVPILCGGSITLLAARLQRLAAFVSVDTGPMHVAAAVDVPIVALFGPTRPEVTGPYSRSGRNVVLRDADLPCSPCRGRSIECSDNVCMTYHTPARILDALHRLVGTAPRSGT